MGVIGFAAVWDRQMHKYEIYRQFEMKFFIINFCNVNISKIEHLRIKMISEINILIEVLSYYKHNCKNKIILEENIDSLLSKCASKTC